MKRIIQSILGMATTIALLTCLPAYGQLTTTEVQRLLASDESDEAAFGRSVAIDGDTAVIGASGKNWSDLEGAGAAYIFTFATGAWTQEGQVDASIPKESDGFGFSVDLDGDTAVFGAPFANQTGTDAAVYVFERSGRHWIERAKLTPSGGETEGHFGFAVALDGNTLVIGAPSADGLGTHQCGAAYVFERSGGAWIEQAKLLASDSAYDDQFGISVALHGDTVIIGASQSDDGGLQNNGAAYVFARSGGLWTEQAKLLASDQAAGDKFGDSVALDGDTAFVGALWQDHGDTENNGAAYVFKRSDGLWAEESRLLAGNKASGDRFGDSVALNGDTAVIGASGVQSGDEQNVGAAYIFERSDGSWAEAARLLASDRAHWDNFGMSVALDQDTVLGGAPFKDVSGDSNGAAYVFERSPRPEEINNLVTFEPDPSTYAFTRNTTGCPAGFIGKFRFEAQLRNVSESALSMLHIGVAELSNGNLLVAPSGEVVGVGVLLPVPWVGGYADGLLASSEYVDVPFAICLRSRHRFTFSVDVLGIRASSVVQGGVYEAPPFNDFWEWFGIDYKKGPGYIRRATFDLTTVSCELIFDTSEQFGHVANLRGIELSDVAVTYENYVRPTQAKTLTLEFVPGSFEAGDGVRFAFSDIDVFVSPCGADGMTFIVEMLDGRVGEGLLEGDFPYADVTVFPQ